jgi:AcrR family transcriptional regulator
MNAAHRNRAEEQRGRILDTARRCFIRDGFHGASMASVAQEAGMSPGLIYRYFGGKHDIILAIIAQQLDLARQDLGQLQGGEERLYAIFLQLFDDGGAAGDALSAPLFLEISAEATRDTAVASAVQCSDRQLRQQFVAWLSRPRPEGGLGMDPARATRVTLLIQCLWEGVLLRLSREPELAPEQLKAGLALLLPLLLEGHAPD